MDGCYGSSWKQTCHIAIIRSSGNTQSFSKHVPHFEDKRLNTLWQTVIIKDRVNENLMKSSGSA